MSRMLQVKVEDDEYERISQAAQAAGMTVAEYLARLVRTGVPPAQAYGPPAGYEIKEPTPPAPLPEREGGEG